MEDLELEQKLYENFKDEDPMLLVIREVLNMHAL